MLADYSCDRVRHPLELVYRGTGTGTYKTSALFVKILKQSFQFENQIIFAYSVLNKSYIMSMYFLLICFPFKKSETDTYMYLQTHKMLIALPLIITFLDQFL